MARADLILTLATAGTRRDDAQFQSTLRTLIEEERAKQHHVLADRLEAVLEHPLTKRPASAPSPIRTALYTEIAPTRTLSELLLEPVVEQQVREVVEEQQRAGLLRSHGLEPRHRIMLVGPPGNGKTTLAEAIAAELFVPLISIRNDAIVGSFLGETAERLREVFDAVRLRECVLLIDEFDALGKERGDEHEVGEVKRVVSALLQQLDDLPPHVLVVVATNHPELLDRAVWRRFQVRVELPRPSAGQIADWLDRFADAIGLGTRYPRADVLRTLEGLSFAEVEEFCRDVQRRLVLDDRISPRNVMIERSSVWRNRYHHSSV